MVGFIILLGQALLMAAIYLYMKKNKKIDSSSVKSMIFSTEKVSTRVLVFSVLAAWMWTTSIFGSAETFALYGIWGPLGYVVGACIAFGIFTPLLCKMMQLMPMKGIYLTFIGKRFGKETKAFYYLFAFLVAAYVLIEQAVGVAYILEILFGTHFKWIAFLSVMIAVSFVCLGGIRCLLLGEQITAVLIMAGFVLLLLFSVPKGIDVHKIICYKTVAGGWLQDVVLIAAGRYFLMAIVIAFSQLVFDPAYYIKGQLAKDLKQLKKAYFMGGILLWGSISLVFSTYLGYLSATERQPVAGLFTNISGIVFSSLITIIGISTVAHYLMGLFGIFTADYYAAILKPKATDREKIVFGRLMTVAIGTFCALIAISLENISLLTIDVFCAIFFAAPCGPLMIGIFTKSHCGKWPMIATITGIIAGTVIWVSVSAQWQWDQFLGMSTSLLLPIIIMIAVNILDRKEKM